MKFAIAGLCAVSLGVLSFSIPARAEVIASSESGFVVRVSAEVAASPDDAWKELVNPADWWSKAHTFSGDAANLYIDSQATGCFCEKLPPAKDAPAGRRAGSVEHMRIVHVDPSKVLRMSGGLGPLQSEALNGTLTILLKPVNGNTRILWEYVVGGYMRYKAGEIVPAVDKVLAEQIGGLAAKLGPVAPAPSPGGKSGAAVPSATSGALDANFLEGMSGEAPAAGEGEASAPPATKSAVPGRRKPEPRDDADYVEPTR